MDDELAKNIKEFLRENLAIDLETTSDGRLKVKIRCGEDVIASDYVYLAMLKD